MLILFQTPFPKSEETIRKIADKILEYQSPGDGVIFLYPLEAEENTVIPYFSNYASIGLCLAYSRIKDKRYLEAVKSWLDWYAFHMNPDGTIYDYKGTPNHLKSTGDYDSSDAYAGTFITAVWYVYRVSQDKVFLKKMYKAVKRAVEGIKLTLQEDNLTYAKPNYPVKYLMDNVEVWRGINDAVRIANALGYEQDEKVFHSLAKEMLKSIEEKFWDEENHCYASALYPLGLRERGLRDWYPQQMANLMAIAWLPFSEKRQKLYLMMKEKFPPGEESDIEKLIWWGMAGKGAKEEEDVEDYLKKIENGDWFNLSPPLLGHLLYLLIDFVAE
ncbi:MAG: hypothetical protein ACP5QS_07630 [bacterium]